MTLPLIALTSGDPAGIGPEVVRAALADEALAGELRLVVLGPRELCPDGLPEHPAAGTHAWLATGGAGWRVGEATREGGDAALRALRKGHELAAGGAVEALVTAPVSKEALHLAGEAVEGQTELLARWSGTPEAQMAVLAGPLRILLLTRHMPLAQALRSIRPESVAAHLRLLHDALRGLGIEAPRIALAGLNPHAGEGGLLGSEERELLEPALAEVRRAGLDVRGPVSPDSVFIEAAQGRHDGVLALYHDQAFIAAKLYGALARPAVTWIAGLPYLRLSPAHGTAFDIAGRGLADPSGLLEALRQAATLARGARG